MIVEGMRRGLSPKDAIMDVCKTIEIRCIRDPRRRNQDGRLRGNVLVYSLSEDGKSAGGSILHTTPFRIMSRDDLNEPWKFETT
jgi:hypothetical protein